MLIYTQGEWPTRWRQKAKQSFSSEKTEWLISTFTCFIVPLMQNRRRLCPMPHKKKMSDLLRKFGCAGCDVFFPKSRGRWDVIAEIPNFWQSMDRILLLWCTETAAIFIFGDVYEICFGIMSMFLIWLRVHRWYYIFRIFLRVFYCWNCVGSINGWTKVIVLSHSHGWKKYNC